MHVHAYIRVCCVYTRKYIKYKYISIHIYIPFVVFHVIGENLIECRRADLQRMLAETRRNWKTISTELSLTRIHFRSPPRPSPCRHQLPVVAAVALSSSPSPPLTPYCCFHFLLHCFLINCYLISLDSIGPPSLFSLYLFYLKLLVVLLFLFPKPSCHCYRLCYRLDYRLSHRLGHRLRPDVL